MKSVMTTEPVTTTKPATKIQLTTQSDLSRYQYNHPPVAYQPIPVAIVYDQKNNRGAKKYNVSVINSENLHRTDATSVDSTVKQSSTKQFKQEIDDIKVTTWRSSSIPGSVTTTRPVTSTKYHETSTAIAKMTEPSTTTKRIITKSVETTQTMQKDLSRYQYNHPPVAYQPIPVAIVYDEKNNRGSNQFNDSVSNTESTITTGRTSVDSTYTPSLTKYLKEDIDDIKITTWRSPSTPGVTTTRPITTTASIATIIHHSIAMGIDKKMKSATATKSITSTEQTLQNKLLMHQYNHPPESYQPIPAAIVYDDKKNREIKQLTDLATSTDPIQKNNVTFSDTTNKESSTKHLKQEDIKVTTFRPLNTVGRQNEITTSNPKQFYPTAEQFIPVAIVYDPEPIILRKKIADEALSKPDAKKQSRKQKQYIDVGTFRHTTAQVTTIISSSTSSPPELVTINDNLPQQNEIQYINQNRYTPRRHVTTQKSSSITSKPITENQTNKYFKDVKISTTTKAPKDASEIKMREEKISVKPSSDIKSSVLSQESDHDRSNSSKKREKDPVVPILESENHVYAQTGTYYYSYEGGDGTKAYSNGVLKEFDNKTTGESVSGGFSYTDGEGRGVRLTYTADENGYRPIGDHLPTPPPIPPQIARALAHLATKPTEKPEEDATEPTKEA